MTTDEPGDQARVRAAAAEDERARLESALYGRLAQLTALRDLGLRALRVPVAELLEASAAVVEETLGAERVMIVERRADGRLRVIAGHGFDEGVVGRAVLDGHSLSGLALETREPVVAADYAADSRFTPAAFIVRTGARAAVAAVIEARGEEVPFGVLVAFSSRPGVFSPDDAAFVQSVANVLAAAIDRERTEARAREELTALYAESQRAVRDRDEILSIVSHDLRSPLNAIGLAAAALESRIGDAEPGSRRHLSVIRRSSGRMDRLIGDLLDMARIRAGRLAVEPAEHDAAELLDEALQVEASGAEEKGIHLVRGGDQPPLPAAFDHDRILQVLANLLGNAIKFTPAGGTVTASVRREPGGVRFEVADSGPGVPRADVERVFDAYWTRGALRASGTGLGLFISRGIVEAHGGRIGLDAKPGPGARFWFELPARPPPPSH